MRMRQAVVGFTVLTVVYFGALVWIDARSHVFSTLPRLVQALPFLAALSLATYLVRYARWYWLLARAGSRTGLAIGFVAYMAGFAFTATPGKVGELLRVRYLSRLGVPPQRVIAAFVVERAADLVVVLALASLAIRRRDLFVLAAVFVAVLIASLTAFALRPGGLSGVASFLRMRGRSRIALVVESMRDALITARGWITPRDLVVVLLLGAAAWSVASASFVWLVAQLGARVEFTAAFAIFPLAMLAGAASLLPGGIGSTEAVIVALLVFDGVSAATATLAAVGIRLASIWFATLCGIACAGFLEWRRGGNGRDPAR